MSDRARRWRRQAVRLSQLDGDAPSDGAPLGVLPSVLAYARLPVLVLFVMAAAAVWEFHVLVRFHEREFHLHAELAPLEQQNIETESQRGMDDTMRRRLTQEGNIVHATNASSSFSASEREDDDRNDQNTVPMDLVHSPSLSDAADRHDRNDTLITERLTVTSTDVHSPGSLSTNENELKKQVSANVRQDDGDSVHSLTASARPGEPEDNMGNEPRKSQVETGKEPSEFERQADMPQSRSERETDKEQGESEVQVGNKPIELAGQTGKGLSDVITTPESTPSLMHDHSVVLTPKEESGVGESTLPAAPSAAFSTGSRSNAFPDTELGIKDSATELDLTAGASFEAIRAKEKTLQAARSGSSLGSGVGRGHHGLDRGGQAELPQAKVNPWSEELYRRDEFTNLVRSSFIKFTPCVLVVWATFEQRALLLNWMMWIMGSARIERFMIVTHDARLHSYLEQREIRSFLYHERRPVDCPTQSIATSRPYTDGNLLARKLRFIYNLLAFGQSVLLSDLDAIWLRDPVYQWRNIVKPKGGQQVTYSVAFAKAAPGEDMAKQHAFDPGVLLLTRELKRTDDMIYKMQALLEQDLADYCNFGEAGEGNQSAHKFPQRPPPPRNMRQLFEEVLDPPQLGVLRSPDTFGFVSAAFVSPSPQGVTDWLVFSEQSVQRNCSAADSSSSSSSSSSPTRSHIVFLHGDCVVTECLEEGSYERALAAELDTIRAELHRESSSEPRMAVTLSGRPIRGGRSGSASSSTSSTSLLSTHVSTPSWMPRNAKEELALADALVREAQLRCMSLWKLPSDWLSIPAESLRRRLFRQAAGTP
ncbi:hypothetical protein FVE85_9042 [Porphyridium purpureum]|uniref:Nucleotide-diphospho-sugar transferase domain-containing protein n=1 Tax=Porphyridium purpureum TaxID=35688 RepID=A0A5J4YP85_PORPP|nr:hypothetical protein FVE85_9042 [Porphyridium purpureum]|eukprot:POR9308..scf222_8